VCQQPIRARLCSYKEENETSTCLVNTSPLEVVLLIGLTHDSKLIDVRSIRLPWWNCRLSTPIQGEWASGSMVHLAKIHLSDLLDSTAFFVRVSIVQSNLGQTTDPYTSYQYASVKAPNGLEAATGEIIQTPERLKKLDGRSGSLCIFAKLSVRVPGVFRLKFTLYETTA